MTLKIFRLGLAMTIKIFNYPVSKRLILLILGDLLIVNGSIFLSAILRLGVSAGWGYIQSNPLVIYTNRLDLHYGVLFHRTL